MEQISTGRQFLGWVHVVVAMILLFVMFNFGFGYANSALFVLPFSVVAVFNLVCAVFILKRKRLLWSVSGLVSIIILAFPVWVLITVWLHA